MTFTRTFLMAVVACWLSACVQVNSNPHGTKVDPEKAYETNIKLGMAYLNKGERDRALRAFDDALNINRRYADAYQGIAYVHQLNGENDEAEKNFKKAMSLKSKFSDTGVTMSYARFLYEHNRCADALPYLKKAGDDLLYPGRDMALYGVGICALRENDETRAIGAFEHAINIQPKNSAAAIELADIYFKNQEFAKAKKYLDQYSANAQQSARSLLLGIKIERVFGNKDKESSYALALKNLHPYSKEYLEYKSMTKTK